MDEFIAIVKIFAGNFAPRGWMLCQGQILSIAQNTALFSLLGTTYGGNGQTTFALPDLRGRFPIGAGQGPGLSNYSLGQMAGTENTTLTTNNMPVHAHPVAPAAAGDDAVSNAPAGRVPGALTGNIKAFLAPSQVTDPKTMAPYNTGPAGGSSPFSIVSPYTCVNYIICVEGIYPSRN